MKKIVICVFSVLILVTAIAFVVGAMTSYNYDIKNFSDDKWVGFDTVLTLMIGGFVVFYELDLFYTVYYFFIKPKTIAKSILNILANASLLLVFFADCYKNIFSEDVIAVLLVLSAYVVLRISALIIPNRRSDIASV